MEYERKRTILLYWKTIANEKCTAEIGELSSVKNLFWANYALEKTQNNIKRKIIRWTNVATKKNCLNFVILENWVRNGQKKPKIA